MEEMPGTQGAALQLDDLAVHPAVAAFLNCLPGQHLRVVVDDLAHGLHQSVHLLLGVAFHNALGLSGLNQQLLNVA